MSAAMLVPASPEILLFLTAIFVVLADFRATATRPRLTAWVALGGMTLALAAVLWTFSLGALEVFSRTLVIDPVSQFFKTLLIISGMLTILLGALSREVRPTERLEFNALVALATLSMCIMTSAVHLLLLFLACEAAGIVFYVLTAFKRRSALSSEAGLKLFIYSTMTMILFAAGIVILYGVGSSLNLIDIRTQLGNGGISPVYLWAAFALIFAAVASRTSLFPFHFMTPDVTQGAPSPVTSFFSVSMHIAGIAFALRLCLHLFSVRAEAGWAPMAGLEWNQFIAGAAAATMTIGNLTALFQKNIKRLVGYATVAQMGYLMMGLAVANQVGTAAVLFGLAAYLLFTLGAAFVIQLTTDEAGSEDLRILRGLVWRNPYEGFALCLFLLAAAGLPPLVGFVGRFYILGVVIKEHFYWLAIVGAINWVIGLTYYLSLIRQVFASLPQAEAARPIPSPFPVKLALTGLLLPTLSLGIFWDPLMNRIAGFLASVTW